MFRTFFFRYYQKKNVTMLSNFLLLSFLFNSECAIKVFGKPVHQRYTNRSWGAWMQDSRGNRHKYWYAPDFYGNSLYEYKDRNHYKNNIPDRKYDLGSFSYQGVGHVVYKGSFYFHLANSSSVARYKLSDGSVTLLNITEAIYDGDRSLYSFKNNFFDFDVDENGIWLVYGMNVSKDMLGILKLDPETLQVLKKWELPIKHQSYGNAFIVCGVLYLVQSVTKPKTKVEIAYDLYEDKKLCHQLAFSNPFGKNNMVSFYNNKIYGYDNGNEIMYPVLMLNQKELKNLKSKC